MATAFSDVAGGLSCRQCRIVDPASAKGHMDVPKEQEQSVEERIGSAIGKIFVLALIAFFAWGYASTMVAKLGLF